MASTYVRYFNLKDSLTDNEVVAYWGFLMQEFVPAVRAINGVNAVKLYSGAGALRADLRLVADMDHAGVYESLLRDPSVSRQLGRFYGAIDMTSSRQMFIREMTPDLFKALTA